MTDLLAINDKVLSLPNRTSAQGRKVGSGTRLGKSLAPNLSATRSGEITIDLSLGAPHRQGGGKMVKRDREHYGVGRMGTRQLLQKKQSDGRWRDPPRPT